MVTGWNEWIAGRFKREGLPVAFVDQFDQEGSRDIEMMKGGHGDNYYIDFKWTDNLQKPGDVLDFYLSGDVAPEGRYNYRYSAKNVF